MSESPPLISIPQAPVPDGGVAEWVESFDMLRLRAALFPAKGRVRGSVVLSTGRTEPIEKYYEVIGELQGRGFAVLCHDWRGQGLSDRMLGERLRGHAQGIEPFFDDYRRLLSHFGERLPKPWIAVGHSMGGALTLGILAAGEQRFAGAVLSAPMLGLVTQGWGYVFARGLTWGCSHLGLAGRYLFGDPASPFSITFEKDRLGHHRGRWDRYRAQITACPDLALGNLTWGWLEFALSLSGRLRRPGAVEAIEIPVVIVAAGADDRVLTPVTAAIAKRLRYGRYVEIEGAYHEILMETDEIRGIFWREFDALADDVAPLQAAAVSS